MCGLFGWIGDLRNHERRTLSRWLAPLNDTRGGDSWGYAHPRSDGGGWTRQRGLGDIDRVWRSLSRRKTVMAHTRFATHGAVTVGNAHPFRYLDTLLSHNGCVMFPGMYEQVAVDSQLIAMRVAYGRGLDDLSGNGAVSWVADGDLDAVKLCNIGNGELAVAAILGDQGRTPRGVVWSSERQHLDAAMRAAGVRHKSYRTEQHVVYDVRSDGLFSTSDKLAIGTGERHQWAWDSEHWDCKVG